ncbi:hypothetical protein GGER_15250 [Serratia rubidaea]
MHQRPDIHTQRGANAGYHNAENQFCFHTRCLLFSVSVKLVNIVQLEFRFKSTMKELDIGLVAKLSGVAPSTLRFYEKKG